MNRISRLAAAPLALAALSACNPISFTPTTRSSDGSTVVIGSTIANSTVNGVALSDMVANTVTFSQAMFTEADNTTNRVALRGQTTSGEMSTLTLGTASAPTNMGFNAYARTSAGELPTSGSATLTGKYAALIGNTTGTEWNNNYIAVLTGDASITANFASNVVAGEITNRTLNGGTPSGDVTLTNAPIGAGAVYAGTATTTDLAGLYPSISGSYDGMFGADGTETAGAVKLLYDAGGGSRYIELGTFVAE